MTKKKPYPKVLDHTAADYRWVTDVAVREIEHCDRLHHHILEQGPGIYTAAAYDKAGRYLGKWCFLNDAHIGWIVIPEGNVDNLRMIEETPG